MKDRRDLEVELAALREEIERWKCASMLSDSRGDPDGVTPENLEAHVKALREENRGLTGIRDAQANTLDKLKQRADEAERKLAEALKHKEEIENENAVLCSDAGEGDALADLDAEIEELKRKLAEAEKALRLLDRITDGKQEANGNEPESICQIVERWVNQKRKLAEAREAVDEFATRTDDGRGRMMLTDIIREIGVAKRDAERKLAALREENKRLTKEVALYLDQRDEWIDKHTEAERKLAEAEKKSDSDYIDICMLPDCKHREDGDGLGRMSRRGCRIGDHPRRKAHELVEELEAKLAEAVRECEHLRRVREPLRRIAALEAMLRRVMNAQRETYGSGTLCHLRMIALAGEIEALLPEEGNDER